MLQVQDFDGMNTQSRVPHSGAPDISTLSPVQAGEEASATSTPPTTFSAATSPDLATPQSVSTTPTSTVPSSLHSFEPHPDLLAVNQRIAELEAISAGFGGETEVLYKTTKSSLSLTHSSHLVVQSYLPLSPPTPLPATPVLPPSHLKMSRVYSRPSAPPMISTSRASSNQLRQLDLVNVDSDSLFLLTLARSNFSVPATPTTPATPSPSKSSKNTPTTSRRLERWMRP
ncbi:hypothetical protein M407DRAFT_162499 [Tulasnella calospora MUT 4182]|uniref:Uncharacterized protein n=1 Tax=Tulasnella calospora MUT 4182 TaxID=1051891 RepID=A0A0C3QQJ6_9AGAM|nr:hypothetical protein M407DRAFT_162499 [Tulasnella calospora MUT 4182]